ncbi:hypothetical protein EBR96_06130 [bacterium]|nr:hypothetical protein [bacterium]
MREKAYRINVPQNDISGIDLLQFWMSSSEVQQIVNRVQQNYLSWDEFKYKSWARADKEKIWAIVRLFRQTQFVDTPIKDFSGSVYKYTPGHYLKFLHEIDLETGGNFMGIDDFSEFDKKRFIRRNLIEESIASSQLEGANTSREVAKKLLRDGTAPRNKGEQMIVNNYAALRAIERELKNEPLSIELLMNLHRIVTANTLSEEYQGRLRNTLDKNGNKLVIKPWDDEIVAYEAPSKEFVERELPRLVDFANHEDSSQFIHPFFALNIL